MIAINAVGGINLKALPEAFILPHQIIDYSYGRNTTFFEDDLEEDEEDVDAR